MTAADRKVYAAVKERAVTTDQDGAEYLACEKCGHNGGKWKLEMHHIVFRSQLPKDYQITPEDVILLCRKCHMKKHSIDIVDSRPMWQNRFITSY